MSPHPPINVGVCGLGGYGASVIHALRHDQASPEPHVRLTAVCSNDFHRHPDAVAELRAAGVKLIDHVDQFLAEPTDAVWLPLPIPLHRPITEKALAAGKAVMCEKPAAGCIDDVDAMIAARDLARRPVLIGFQDVFDPTTLPLKRALLEGRIGPVRSATLLCCWPRGKHYYERSDWAGAFRRDNTWVMDSPAHNAMAHSINIVLFLLGPTLESSAQPVAVHAELYRVNPIENYDTASIRFTLENGVTFLALLTHACQETVGPRIIFQGRHGQIVRTTETIQIQSPGSTLHTTRPHDVRPLLVRRLAHATRGIDDPDIATATLEVARAQVLAVNAASEAAAVKTLPDSLYTTVDLPKDTVRAIPGIERVFDTCTRENKMLHDSGLVEWSTPAGRLDLRGYRHFAGPRDLAPAAPR